MQQIVVRRPPLRLNIVAIVEAIFNMNGNIIQIGIHVLSTIDNVGQHRTCIVENFHERNEKNPCVSGPQPAREKLLTKLQIQWSQISLVSKHTKNFSNR